MPLSRPLSPTPTGGEPGAVRRAVPLFVVAVMAIAVSSCSDGSRIDHPARRTVSGIQGPSLHPARVFSGRQRVTCPVGAEPTVDIRNVTFTPRLTAGTRFGKGRYRISLSGSVVNETTSPVRVEGIGLTVGGTPWHASIARPASLGAGDAQPLIVSGVFRSRSAEQAKVAAHLRWSWRDDRLRRCGSRGLITDD